MINEKRIIQGILNAKKRGFKLAPYYPAIEDKKACAAIMAAVGLHLMTPGQAHIKTKPPHKLPEKFPYERALKLLRMTKEEAEIFVLVFDLGLEALKKGNARKSIVEHPIALFADSLREMID